MASAILDNIATAGKLYAETRDDVVRQQLVKLTKSLTHELETPAEQLNRITWHEPSTGAALRVALELGLLKKLQGKPLSHEALAEGTKADVALVGK